MARVDRLGMLEAYVYGEIKLLHQRQHFMLERIQRLENCTTLEEVHQMLSQFSEELFGYTKHEPIKELTNAGSGRR